MVGVVVIVGLYLVVQDKIRESRQLDDIAQEALLTGKGNGQSYETSYTAQHQSKRDKKPNSDENTSQV